MKKISKLVSFFVATACTVMAFSNITVNANARPQSLPYVNEFTEDGYVLDIGDGWTEENLYDCTISVVNGRLTVEGPNTGSDIRTKNDRTVSLNFKSVSSGTLVVETDIYTPPLPGYNANRGIMNVYSSDGKLVSMVQLNGRGPQATYVNNWSTEDNAVTNHKTWGSNGNIKHRLKYEIDFDNGVWRAYQAIYNNNTDVLEEYVQYVTKSGANEFPFADTTATNASKVRIAMTQEEQYIDNIKIYEKIESEQIKNSYDLFVGDEQKAEIKYNPSDKVYGDIVWSSDDENVVKTDQNGMLYAIAPGYTEVSATSKAYDINYCYKVKVWERAKSITIDQKDAIIYPGETLRLTYSSQPKGSTAGNVSWTSNKTDVATVNSDGIITAKGKGIAQITATSEYGDSATYNIEVVDFDDSESVVDFTNPDFEYFENSFRNWIPVGQTIDGVKNAAPAWVMGGATSSSVGCAKLTETSYLQHYLPLEEGNRYTLSAKLKIESMEEGSYASLQVGYQSWYYTDIINFFEKTNGWETKTLDFIVPKGAQNPSIMLRFAGKGEAYFDDVRIINQKDISNMSLYSDGLYINSMIDDAPLLNTKFHYVSRINEPSKLFGVMYNKNSVADMKSLSVANDSVSTDITDLVDASKLTKDSSVKIFNWNDINGMKPMDINRQLFSKDKTQMSDKYNFFVKNRMRGVYGGPDDIYADDIKSYISEYGVNTLIFNIIGTYYGGNILTDMNALDLVLKDAENLAEETGVKVFPKISFGANGTVSNVAFGAFHPGEEHSLSLPCPRSEEYWKAQITDVLSVIATHKKLAGAVVDLEMYSGGRTSYGSPCFCDSCVSDFDNEYGLNLSQIDAITRNQYTKANNLYSKYCSWHKKEITAITSKIREAVHKINPDLIIGYMPQIEWISGITEGLGTHEMPVMIFNENEYTGKIDYMYGNQSRIQLRDLPAVYATGLWSDSTNAISAENFATKAIEAGRNSMGYWIYSTSDLRADSESQAYLNAIKTANDELDSILGNF